MDADDAGIGARLRASREAAGLSQQQLADRSGLSIRAVRNIEHGRTCWPYRDSLTRLADALGLQDAIRTEFLGAVPRRRLARQVPGTGLAEALIVPRQLPAPVGQFVGREAELEALTDMLAQSGGPDSSGVVVISAINGTAGIGKTTLALHWAHRAAARFRDGQLYVDLRGFSAGPPVMPSEVMHGFLDALGVAPERLPAGEEAQAALFRSLVAGRRLLIVLDNARDVAQVRPLLPGSPGCMVLVTSRASLDGLAVGEGARVLTLDVLSDEEARQLLAARLGGERLAADPAAVSELIRLCAELPLALTVAVARLMSRPGFPLAAAAAELREAADRLDALETGDPASSVRPIFSWSYQNLSKRAAAMFRLVGLHPGPDLTAPAAASAAGISLRDARRSLHELTRAHMLTEQPPGRFRCHDLLRAYAAELAAAETEGYRRQALFRVLDHYLHTGHRASALLNPHRAPLTISPASPGVTAEPLATHEQALAWFEAERQVLTTATEHAAARGLDTYAWQIPWTIAPFLDTHGFWPQAATVQRTALAAAGRLADTTARIVSGRLLATTCVRLGDLDQARGHLDDSLRLCQQSGDQDSEARTQQNLAWLAGCQGRYAEALDRGEQAYALFAAMGDRAGQASCLNGIGMSHMQLGDHAEARDQCRRALRLHRELADQLGQAHAWDNIGYAEHQIGRLTQAGACYRRALRLFTELGNRYYQAEVLDRLADNCHAAGDHGQARETWQQALAIFDDLSSSDADRIRCKLGDPSVPGVSGADR